MLVSTFIVQILVSKNTSKILESHINVYRISLSIFVYIIICTSLHLGVSLCAAIQEWVECRKSWLVRKFFVALIHFSLQERRAILPCRGAQCFGVIRIARNSMVIVPEEHIVTCTGPQTQLQMVSFIYKLIISYIQLCVIFSYIVM